MGFRFYIFDGGFAGLGVGCWLGFVALRDARRGERLTADDLGFCFVAGEGVVGSFLRLEECGGIERFVLRMDVVKSQPLMRGLFCGVVRSPVVGGGFFGWLRRRVCRRLVRR